MKTYEATAVIDDQRHGTLDAPADVPPGRHRVLILVDTRPRKELPPLTDFPVMDVGPWPENLTVRREEIYGDNGR